MQAGAGKGSSRHTSPTAMVAVRPPCVGGTVRVEWGAEACRLTAALLLATRQGGQRREIIRCLEDVATDSTTAAEIGMPRAWRRRR